MTWHGPQLELRWRLSLVIGLLLTAALGAAAWVAVTNARAAVQREVGSSLRTATASLDLTLKLLRERPDQDAAATLLAWSAGFSGGRHLCVSIAPSAAAAQGCLVAKAPAGVPAWFARGAESGGATVTREFKGGVNTLRIHLVSDPRDELQEAWFDVRDLLLMMALLAFCLNLSVFVIVSRGLQPLHALVAAMRQIGRGQPVPQLPSSNAPEVQMLADGLGDLATRLAQAKDLVRKLHLRNLDMQEEERRMVARELHDEIGQHVTAIEMETIRIARMSPEEHAQRQSRLQQLRSSIRQIHSVSRRIVQRLRPPQIESLGPSAALEALCDRWRAEHPEPRLSVQLDPQCDQLAPARAVHLYRLVQESLSNVARHAQAGCVWVTVRIEAQQICVRVTDDGRGFDTQGSHQGFGIAGMHERVAALGGNLSLRSNAAAGTIVQAVIPLCGGADSPSAPLAVAEGGLTLFHTAASD